MSVYAVSRVNKLFKTILQTRDDLGIVHPLARNAASILYENLAMIEQMFDLDFEDWLELPPDERAQSFLAACDWLVLHFQSLQVRTFIGSYTQERR